MTKLVQLLLAGVGALAAAAPLEAQDHGPPPSIEQRLVGTWEGVYQSDHVPPGPMRVVVSRDSAWRLTMQVHANDQVFTTVGAEVTLDGNVLSWLHETMGQACRGSVVLEGAALKGETSCGGSGLSFTLAKLPPASGGDHD